MVEPLADLDNDFFSPEFLRANGIAPLPPRGKKRPSDTQGPGPVDAGSSSQGLNANPMESASQKRPRMDTGEEEQAEVKSEQTDEDDDEDRVAFLEVRPLAHLPCTNRILTEHHLGANSHAIKSTCSRKGQEVTDECQTRGLTHTHPRGLYKRSDRPHLRNSGV